LNLLESPTVAGLADCVATVYRVAQGSTHETTAARRVAIVD